MGKESLVRALATSHAMRLAAPVIAAFKARLADAARRANYRPKFGLHLYTRARFQYHNNIKPRRHSNAIDAASTSPVPLRGGKLKSATSSMKQAEPGDEVSGSSTPRPAVPRPPALG